MSDYFEFRPMVSSCLADPRVQAAVDELVKKSFGGGYAQHFGWDEFDSYVDAWLAAQQTAAEWAKDLCDVWKQTWGTLIDASALIPRQTTSPELADGDIAKAWFGSWYTRHVKTESGDVGLVVFGTYDEFHLQIEFKDAKAAAPITLADWENDGEEIDSPSVAVVRSEGPAKLDLSALRDYAAQAIAALNHR